MAREKQRRGAAMRERSTNHRVPPHHTVEEPDDTNRDDGNSEDVRRADADGSPSHKQTNDEAPAESPPGWTIDEATRRAFRAAVAVASTVLAVYVFRLAPSPYLLDSTELVATTAALSVSHPPGHPSFHLLAAGALPLPIGTVAYRVHLAVAAFSALTLAALPLCAAFIGWIRSRTHLWFSSVLAIALAFTPAFAQQSIRAEVYSLNALCLAGATAALCWGRHGQRPFATTLLAAVVLGIGLLNHHYLILLAFPAMLLAVLQRADGGAAKHVIGGSILGALMLGGYLYLPLRALARTRIGWGWPDSLSEIYWTVSAAAFQKTAEGAASVDLATGLGNVSALFAESLTPGVCVAALAGLALLAMRDRGLAIVLAIAIAGNVMSQTLFEFDPKNPDVLGYFMPSFWWLGLALIYLVQAVDLPGSLARLTEPLKVLFGAVVLAGVALSAAGTTWSVDLGDYWDSEYFRDEAFVGLMPNSVWVPAYFETGFNTWYATAVEDRRPDVDCLNQTLASYPFYDEMVAELSPTAVALLDPGEPILSVEALANRARMSDVRVEAESVLPRELARRSIPAGLYLQVLPEEPPPGAFPRDLATGAADALERIRRRFPPLDQSAPDTFEVQTGRNLVWAHFNLGLQMCAAERYVTCRGIIHEARRLAPHDPELAQLAASLEAEAGESRPSE